MKHPWNENDIVMAVINDDEMASHLFRNHMDNSEILLDGLKEYHEKKGTELNKISKEEWSNIDFDEVYTSLKKYKEETAEIKEPHDNNDNTFFIVTCRLGGDDCEMFTNIWNQGIDSHLEGFTKSVHEIDNGRLVLNFHPDEIKTLVRRLEEFGTEEALMWAQDIAEAFNKTIKE